jgi:hypothetical protein
MTQATPYTRQTGFADDERNNAGGRSTVLTADVDAELDSVGVSLNQTIGNLAILQRDDGVLRDGIVPTSALSSATLKLISSFGGVIRGAWATTTAYALKDVVTQAGNTYIAALAHTSGTFATDLAAVRWVLIQIGANPSAAALPFSPSVNVTSSTVQAAILEVDSNSRARDTSGSAALAAAFVALAASSGASTVGFQSAGSGSVADTVQRKLRELVSTKDKGAVADGVTNDATAVFNANAQAVAIGSPLLFEGIHHIGTAITITAPIVDTLKQIFTTASQVTIDNGLPVRPEWFGPVAGLGGNVNGMIRYAVNALPSKGGTVKLVNAAYRSGYDTTNTAVFTSRGGTPGVDYMVRQHISIVGEKLAEYNGARTQMQNGTIIQGTFYISSECTGTRLDLISVDAGSIVMAALYPGITLGIDGLCILQCNKATPAYGTDVHIGSVNALGSGVGTLSHACLFEAISGDLKYAEGVNGYHGVVLKTADFEAGTLVGKGCYGENVIIKSDAYAVLGVTSVGQIVCKGNALNSTAGDYGLLIQGATSGGGGVTIGSLIVDNTNFGFRIEADSTNIVADVSVGSAILRGVTYGYDLVGDVRRTQIGSMKINAVTQGGITVYAGVNEGSHYIGSLSLATVATAGITSASSTGGSLRIGSLMVDAVSGTLFVYNNTSAEVMIEGVIAGQGANGAFSNVTPALQNSWASLGSQYEPFGIGLRNGNVCLKGIITPGTTGTLFTLPANWRPTKDFIAPVMAFNGTTYKSIQLSIVAATGVVSITDLAATTGGNLSLHGVAWPCPYGSGVLY